MPASALTTGATIFDNISALANVIASRFLSRIRVSPLSAFKCSGALGFAVHFKTTLPPRAI